MHIPRSLKRLFTFRRAWAALDHVGRIVLAWQLGISAIVAAIVGWVSHTLNAPWPVLSLLAFGLACLAYSAAGLAAPRLVNRFYLPVEARSPSPTPAVSPPALAPPAPVLARQEMPMSGLEASAARLGEDVLRADLVYLDDELVAARRTIVAAYNNSFYWNEPIASEVWSAVKDKHLGAKGFHRPRSSVAEAYEAIKEAENMRLMNEAEPEPTRAMPDWDRVSIREILDRVVEGENALTGYLNELDVPKW